MYSSKVTKRAYLKGYFKVRVIWYNKIHTICSQKEKQKSVLGSRYAKFSKIQKRIVTFKIVVEQKNNNID